MKRLIMVFPTRKKHRELLSRADSTMGNRLISSLYIRFHAAAAAKSHPFAVCAMQDYFFILEGQRGHTTMEFLYGERCVYIHVRAVYLGRNLIDRPRLERRLPDPKSLVTRARHSFTTVFLLPDVSFLFPPFGLSTMLNRIFLKIESEVYLMENYKKVYNTGLLKA